jgi:hypothetical protein
MKYKLETIPVIDAIKEDTECSLCFLEDKAEKYYLQFYIGPSVMVPETRVEVNKTGFCPGHHHRLLNAGEAQNIGLVTHTYMADLNRGQQPLIQEILKQSDGKTSLIPSMSRLKNLARAVDRWMDYLTERTERCLICDRLEETIKRYLFTIVYNWDKDPEFRELFAGSRGFCHLHLKPLYAMAGEVLSAAKRMEFVSALTTLQSAQYPRIDGELEWFTQKFKQENFSKPWGTSADAHKRAVKKVSGRDKGQPENRNP